MIHKLSRKMISVYVFLGSFFLSLFSLMTYFYATNKVNLWTEIFQARIFYIPIIVYLLLISIGMGVLTFLLITLMQRFYYNKIEEKLRVLSIGNYDAKVLDKAIDTTEETVYLTEIENDIKNIKKKMLAMSSELQTLNSRPQYVAGETREEILEAERHRLARELHDSVSQQLFAAMMMMSALNEQAQKNDTPEKFRKQLALVADIINASQSEMRALLLHLRPVNLEGKRLKQGIEQLLRELQTKIQISLKWDVEDVTLPTVIEDHLFRIVQELLSNTLRHAKADELEVYLHRIENNILLRVVDDGVGFDVEQSKAGSYGLNNIRERVIGIGGTCKIISFKGQGTSIEIKIPLVEEVNTDD
ncbi:MAG: sensor histidine kinase [Enterococcus sp.]